MLTRPCFKICWKYFSSVCFFSFSFSRYFIGRGSRGRAWGERDVTFSNIMKRVWKHPRLRSRANLQWKAWTHWSRVSLYCFFFCFFLHTRKGLHYLQTLNNKKAQNDTIISIYLFFLLLQINTKCLGGIRCIWPSVIRLGRDGCVQDPKPRALLAASRECC